MWYFRSFARLTFRRTTTPDHDPANVTGYFLIRAPKGAEAPHPHLWGPIDLEGDVPWVLGSVRKLKKYDFL